MNTTSKRGTISKRGPSSGRGRGAVRGGNLQKSANDIVLLNIIKLNSINTQKNIRGYSLECNNTLQTDEYHNLNWLLKQLNMPTSTIKYIKNNLKTSIEKLFSSTNIVWDGAAQVYALNEFMYDDKGMDVEGSE